MVSWELSQITVRIVVFHKSQITTLVVSRIPISLQKIIREKFQIHRKPKTKTDTVIKWTSVWTYFQHRRCQFQFGSQYLGIFLEFSTCVHVRVWRGENLLPLPRFASLYFSLTQRKEVSLWETSSCQISLHNTSLPHFSPNSLSCVLVCAKGREDKRNSSIILFPLCCSLNLLALPFPSLFLMHVQRRVERGETREERENNIFFSV